jgi:hypothetical protein
MLRPIHVLLFLVLLSCTPLEATAPNTANEIEQTEPYETYSSGTELITEPADTTTIERCTEGDQNECKVCLISCDRELSLCLLSANTDFLRLECRVERDDCKKECRRNVNVLCDCR